MLKYIGKSTHTNVSNPDIENLDNLVKLVKLDEEDALTFITRMRKYHAPEDEIKSDLINEFHINPERATELLVNR